MEVWELLKVIWTGTALILLWLALILFWRFRDLIGWRRSLAAELAVLEEIAGNAPDPVRNGAEIVRQTCRRTLRSAAPDLRELGELRSYVQSIAVCFHPHAENPELQIRVRSVLETVEKALNQLDLILQRPGFGRLRSMSLHTVLETHRWYLQITETTLYRWFTRYRRAIQRIALLRFAAFVDPLIWLVYLSRRLTQLVFVKYLMADLYVFIGKLALEAYDESETPDLPETESDIEETLSELDELADLDEASEDPRIQEIRNRLVGFASVLASNPTYGDWREAVIEAAGVVSRRHFPDSDHPLEEAAIGPLLDSARQWAIWIGKGAETRWLKHLYSVRLETVLKAKDLTYSVFPESVQSLLKRGYQSYGRLKWPLKAYRTAKRFTPWKLSLEIGWMLSKKASLAYLYGRAFDTACRELESVYRSSRDLREG